MEAVQSGRRVRALRVLLKSSREEFPPGRGLLESPSGDPEEDIPAPE